MNLRKPEGTSASGSTESLAESVKEIRARSASGAAALGWYHLLRGRKLDDGLIVLAQIDDHGQLDGVEGVPAKVKAIVEAARFDTIVLASHKNLREARNAAQAIGALEQATDALLEKLSALLREHNLEVRSCALDAMKALGKAVATDTFLEGLCTLLRDKDYRVRSSALDAVSALGKVVATDEILERLSILLRDKDYRVRYSALDAVKAVRKVAATDAILESLSALLRDDELRVRSSAAKAVSTLGEAAATDAILQRLPELLCDKDTNVRSSALYAVSVLGEAAVTDTILENLLILLRDYDWKVRSSAAECLNGMMRWGVRVFERNQGFEAKWVTGSG